MESNSNIISFIKWTLSCIFAIVQHQWSLGYELYSLYVLIWKLTIFLDIFNRFRINVSHFAIRNLFLEMYEVKIQKFRKIGLKITFKINVKKKQKILACCNEFGVTYLE